MNKVSEYDFGEEIIYHIGCPKCEGMIETSEDLAYIDELYCESCNEVIIVEH